MQRGASLFTVPGPPGSLARDSPYTMPPPTHSQSSVITSVPRPPPGVAAIHAAVS